MATKFMSRGVDCLAYKILHLCEPGILSLWVRVGILNTLEFGIHLVKLNHHSKPEETDSNYAKTSLNTLHHESCITKKTQNTSFSTRWAYIFSVVSLSIGSCVWNAMKDEPLFAIHHTC